MLLFCISVTPIDLWFVIYSENSITLSCLKLDSSFMFKQLVFFQSWFQDISSSGIKAIIKKTLH